MLATFSLIASYKPTRSLFQANFKHISSEFQANSIAITLRLVRFELVRSADPPTISGITAARAFNTSSDLCSVVLCCIVLCSVG